MRAEKGREDFVNMGQKKTSGDVRKLLGEDDGFRTHDPQNHNLML